MSDSLREKIAALCHEQWSGWMEYLFEHGIWVDVGARQDFTIGYEEIERWTRQMNTPYSELSEAEKDSDRKEADKFLRLINHIERKHLR